MKETKIFPRAMVMDLDRAFNISKQTLGIDIKMRADNNCKAFFESNEDESFLLIVEMVQKALTVAMKPFQEMYGEKNGKELLQYYHYNKIDLEAIAVFIAIDNLMDQFTLTKKINVVQSFDDLYPKDDEEIRNNEKSVDKLYQKGKKRNSEHLIYMGYDENIRSIVKSKDVTYYEFLSKFKTISDFLYTDKIPIGKKLIETFAEAYEYIDDAFGFDRFSLEYRLERDSKIDYMTHMTYIIYNMFLNKTFDKKTMDNQLCRIVLPCRYRAYKETEYEFLSMCAIEDENVKFVYEEYFMAMNEILSGGGSNYYKSNNIVFGLNDMYDYYKPLSNKIMIISECFRELNIIVEAAGACVANIISNILIHNALKRYTERNKPEYRGKYRERKKECEVHHAYINGCIENIVYSREAAKYFDNYMDYRNSCGSHRVILNMTNFRSIAKYLNKVYLNQ